MYPAKCALSLRLLNRCKSLRSRFLHSSSVYKNEFKPNESEKTDTTQPDEHHNVGEEPKHDFTSIAENRFIYPEFLPDPYYEFRNKLREKLERADMLKHRCNIDIPEFYVGSVLAVTTSDPYTASKQNRFVGICIARTHTGLRATFTLRNIVDNQGVEITYDLYNPTIHRIEVLRLEKRLDDNLLYLRDCDPIHSTFPFDMEPEYHPEGEPVPVNPIKVKLGPRPWNRKWHIRNRKGLEPFEEYLTDWDKHLREKNDKPWEQYDLMKQYRRCIPEEDQQAIWEEVEMYRKQFQARKHEWKQKVLQKAPAKVSERDLHNS